MSLFHSIQIGNLKLDGNIFLAPVAGYSDRAFRSVCISGGANLCYTEMVSSEALTRGSDKSEVLLLRAPNEKNLAVQLFGSTPETMAQAASSVIKEVNPQLIDINAGCPVPKIVKTGAGSFLTKNPDKLALIVKAVCQAAKEANPDKPIPVTVKIRSGWDSTLISWKEAAIAAVSSGAAAITLHPRTKTQGYEGKANWLYLQELSSVIKEYKDITTGNAIPVFGSGDVFSPEDAKKMLEDTGCDGVMFARGAMGNPFIFNQTRQLLETGNYEEISVSARIEEGLKELYLLVEDKGERIACKEMRKRFCGYTKGISGGAQLRADVVKAETVKDYEKTFSLLLSKTNNQTNIE